MTAALTWPEFFGWAAAIVAFAVFLVIAINHPQS